MNTRDKILKAVLDNQPAPVSLPEIVFYDQDAGDPAERFADTLTNIGGRAVVVDKLESVAALLPVYFDTSRRVATHMPELAGVAGLVSLDIDPHSFQDVELMVVKAHFGVAENGAVWITEQLMGQRILPFICQHLAVVLYSGDIVPTMQQAYERIGEERYRFGSFIAGPSKTADIEQALVLGAHGPRTMTVFIFNS
jgi:L-lactate dehydrogenase complex protein LldG